MMRVFYHLTMTISLEWSGTGKAHQIAMSIRLLSNVYFLFIFSREMLL